MIEITAVIATMNRRECLHRLLASIAAQTLRPVETLIVDASDAHADETTLRESFPSLGIRVLPAKPSVCAQRNLGIAEARTDYIFLCDDDMELPSNYLLHISEHFTRYPLKGAVSGIVVHSDGTAPEQRAPGLFRLLWSTLFLQSVWGDVAQVPSPFFFDWVVRVLKRFYRRRGNTITPAGWPLLTQLNDRFFMTKIYGLGSSVVRRRWLCDSPYDERLAAHGIGDNYGVALRFPDCITVLADNPVIHHRVETNRLEPHVTHLNRILALHLFVSESERFRWYNRMFLLWSLAGMMVEFVLRNEMPMLKATALGFRAILLRKNPLRAGTQTPVRRCLEPVG